MRVKFDESLKISGPYGNMDAKFQPCQDDVWKAAAGRRIFRRWRRCL